MKRKLPKALFIISCAVIISVITGCVSRVENDESKKEISVADVEKNVETNSSAEDNENIIYETMDTEYIEKAISYISTRPYELEECVGVWAYDMNDDGTPELFTLESSENRYILKYQNGGETTEHSSPKSDEEYFVWGKWDMMSVEKPHQFYFSDPLNIRTFYENPDDFVGIYKDKNTGEKAVLSCMVDYIETNGNMIPYLRESSLRYRDECTAHGDNLYLIGGTLWTDWKEVEAEPETVHTAEYITCEQYVDEILKDYELTDEPFDVEFQMRGGYDSESIAEAFDNQINTCFDVYEKEFDVINDGVFDCYIHNVYDENKEIALIPAAIITYEDYNDAFRNDGYYKISDNESDDFEYVITHPEVDNGYAYLFTLPGFEYPFHIPTEEKPVSIIENYFNNTPVKVKMTEDTVIRYGVVSYSENGEPLEYETLGRNAVMTPEEFFSHYAEYSFRGHYKATVKNGVLTCLDVIYYENDYMGVEDYEG